MSLNPPMTVTRRIRSPGRARNKPLKPLRGECREESGEPVATMLVCFTYHSHARLWVQRAPGIPCALCFWANGFCKNSDASRREIAEAYLKLGRRHCEER